MRYSIPKAGALGIGVIQVDGLYVAGRFREILYVLCRNIFRERHDSSNGNAQNLIRQLVPPLRKAAQPIPPLIYAALGSVRHAVSYHATPAPVIFSARRATRFIPRYTVCSEWMVGRVINGLNGRTRPRLQ